MAGRMRLSETVVVVAGIADKKNSLHRLSQELVEQAGVNIAESLSRGWIRTYNNASTNLAEYVDKRVLLLGRGNAVSLTAKRWVPR